MKTFRLMLMLLFIAVCTFGQTQKLSNRLAEKLQTMESNDYVRTMVIFEDQVDVFSMDQDFYAENASIERRTLEVITALKAKANSTQQSMLNFLAEKERSDEVFKYEPYWVVNMIMVEAKPSVVYEMAAKNEVAMIDEDGLLERDMPIKNTGGSSANTESVEDGVKIINADKLWELGITGAGRIVMGIDTGVDPTHPALSHKWRGNHVPANQAWIDPGGGTTNPNDCDDHGTHTMGTMTGRSNTTNDTVGVAIDAEWIAAKTICSSPHTSNTVTAFQWAMDPDGDSTTISDMPDAICNSWYDPGIGDECTSIYVNTFNALEAVGIAVVFSAGNSGSGSSTITKPKNINTTLVNSWATAAIDGPTYLGGSNDPITSFSSRGPSICGGTGSLLIKPEAAAPGNNVRSSVIGGGYSSFSGTSMAAPHVVGAIALLRQFAPNLTGSQIKLALYNTAEDLGTPGEDNTYGMGLIDVYAAFLSLGTPDIYPPDQIVDLSVMDITSSDLKLTWSVPYDSSMGGIAQYDVRWSSTMISDTNDFYAANVVPFTEQPGDSGETEMLVVEGLDFYTDYYFAVRSADVWGNWSDISNVVPAKTFDAPVINVTPDSLHAEILNTTVVKDTIFIANVSDSASTLDYEITLENNTFPESRPLNMRIVNMAEVGEAELGDELKNEKEQKYGSSLEGAGGPDAFGYEWIDSDEPNGPAYVWNDISTTGTAVTSWTPTGSFGAADEGYAGPFSLGFPFKFYGNIKNDVYVSTNGVVTFGAISSNIYSNGSIPSTSTPNDLIAPFWDDLDGRNQGEVYYQQDGDKFIIQYDNWPGFSSSAGKTFQVVLHSSGKIVIYYENMTGTLSSCTVGIENATGTDGLQVVRNATYVKNGLALQFAAEPDWLAPSNISGRIYNANTVGLEMTFSSEDYPLGDYSMDVVIASNDPVTWFVTVPVTMEIVPIPVELTSFKASTFNNAVELVWNTATETNNQGFDVERKLDNESQWNKIGFMEGKINSSERSVYNFKDSFENIAYKGKAQYRLKQIDLDGTIDYSNQIAVEVDFTPAEYSLEQNYPNPFNPATTIKYTLPNHSSVKLSIYNTLGEIVTELVNEVQETGYYEIQWDASNLSSGMYIYTLEAQSIEDQNDFRSLKKMLLVK